MPILLGDDDKKRKDLVTVIMSRLRKGDGKDVIETSSTNEIDSSAGEKAIGAKAIRAVQSNDPALFFSAIKDAFIFCEGMEDAGEEGEGEYL